jgi:hypothetical protein
VLGATVLFREGSTLKHLWLGLDEALLPGLATAVSGALYYFGLVYAYESGASIFDFCDSRSLLTDGVLRHKYKWGASLRASRDPSTLLLKPRNFSVPTVSFFVHHPFLSPLGSSFRVRLLSTQVPLSVAAIEKALNEHSMPGIARFEFNALAGLEPDAIAWAKGHPSVHLRDLRLSNDPTREFCAS